MGCSRHGAGGDRVPATGCSCSGVQYGMGAVLMGADYEVQQQQGAARTGCRWGNDINGAARLWAAVLAGRGSCGRAGGKEAWAVRQLMRMVSCERGRAGRAAPCSVPRRQQQQRWRRWY